MKTRLLLLLLLFPWCVYAQSLTLTGVVRARADRMGLPGVTVLGTANGTSTNAQGRFTLVLNRSTWGASKSVGQSF